MLTHAVFGRYKFLLAPQSARAQRRRATVEPALQRHRGVPLWLLPIIVRIELTSYLIRPISHSESLFANMTAGHTMPKVFAGVVVCSAAGHRWRSSWPSLA